MLQPFFFFFFDVHNFIAMDSNALLQMTRIHASVQMVLVSNGSSKNHSIPSPLRTQKRGFMLWPDECCAPLQT